MGNSRRPFPNKDIFEVIDTEEKAYWLGFLYADGSVGSTDYRVELGLSLEDIKHVEKFKAFIGLDNKISIREKTKSCRYAFKNKDFKQHLINKGCVPNKSLVLKFPTKEQVPKHLIRHFMRGYMDGDGWLSYTDKFNQIGFIGTLDFVEKAIEEFEIGGNKIQNVHREDGAKRYMIADKKRVVKFLNTLYQDATIYLDRKYENYLKIINDFAVS
ncbi:MAG: hypothetical protein HUJ68_06250 [Clostridia bacterium]|nr:hypothetical protein [Clostridia bacterium]